MLIRYFYLLLFICLSLQAVSQVADFSVSQKTGCAPFAVTFTDNSQGSPMAKREWNIGGLRTFRDSLKVVYLFDVAGRYIVTLKVTFPDGERTKTDTIVVNPTPVASFSITDTAGCSPHTVQLIDGSSTQTGNILKRFWNVDDQPSTDKDPTFTLNEKRDYTVKLYVENTFGCKSTTKVDSNSIHVYEAVKANFIIRNNYSCDTLFNVKFDNRTSGGGSRSYRWLFGDGDSSNEENPQHTYIYPGVYNVQLTAQNGMKCINTYSITNGVIVGRPHPTIKALESVCANSSVSFSGSVAPASFTNLVTWKWVIPGATLPNQPTVSHKFTDPGVYDVLLIVYYNANCSDTAHHLITVQPGPKPDFTFDNGIGCNTSLTVNFSDRSEPSTGLQYHWYFGDGLQSDLQNPSHLYTSEGLFTVSLEVKDGTVVAGCTTVMQKINAIRIAKPRVEFTYLPPEGCAPLPVTTTARITNVIDPIASYVWDFGEGQSVATAVDNASHTYASAGTYNIRLKVITQLGCADSSKTKAVAVAKICNDDGSGGGGGGGGFTIKKTCAEKYVISFTDTVRNSKTVSWDFGDSTAPEASGQLKTITHTFPTTYKNYVVSVSGRDTITNKIYTSQKKVIIIDEKATFAPDITNICKDKKVNFITSGIDSSNIDTYTWDFGDSSKTIINNKSYFLSYGTYLNGNSSHAYSQAGDFYVTLTITDKLGCTDSYRYPTPISVKGPVARFSSSLKTTCDKDFMVDFTDSSTQNGSVPIVQWAWNFGNGQRKTVFSRDSLIQTFYQNNSTYIEYPVMLTITDSLGCLNEIRDTIKSFNPKAKFGSNDTLKCGIFTVNFANNSSAHLPTYKWYYGDGTDSAAFAPQHIYKSDGIYDIKLVVKDNNGCMDSVTKTSFIKLIRPKADFTILDTNLCAPVSIRFNDSSDFAVKYRWDFGEKGAGFTDQKASHLYTTSGIYQVKFVIESVNSCKDSIIKTIRIKGPDGKLTTGLNFGCTPYIYEMKVTGKNIRSYDWVYNDGWADLESKDSVVHHTYSSADKFFPQVIIRSADQPDGCPLLLKADPLIVDSINAMFEVDKNQFCDSGYVQFTDHSSASAFSSIKSYKWNFGDGSMANLSSPPLHKFNQPGTYNVSLSVESSYGCKDSFNLQTPISVYNIPIVSIPGEPEICAGKLLHYEAAVSSQDSVAAYAWRLDGDLVSNVNSFDHLFPGAGSHHVSFTVNTRYGCEVTATKDIIIRSLPIPAARPDTTICIGSSIQLHASDGLNYLWSPAADLQNANTADAIASPKQNTLYHVMVTNSFGCVQEDSVSIGVDRKVNLQHTNDLVVCEGESTRLSATGNTQSFLWTPSAGLSNSAIANPVASPKQTTIYQVVGYSNDVCPNDTGFVKITVGNIPTVDLGPDLTVNAGSPLTLNPVVSNDVINYSWLPIIGLSCSTCANPQIIADKDIRYKLTVHSQHGCEASDDIGITVLCGKGAVRIPNAFTPNGDGTNDLFYVMGYGIQRVKSFKIYNRWGRLVFNRENILPNDKDAGWNGLENNKLIPVTTTFVYTAEVICNEGKTFLMKGTVTLIR